MNLKQMNVNLKGIKQEPLAVTPSEGSFAQPIDAYIVIGSG